MKKIITIALIVLMVATLLVGCTQTSENSAPKDESQTPNVAEDIDDSDIGLIEDTDEVEIGEMI